MDRKKLTNEEFLKRCFQKHGENKFIYETLYKNKRTKIEITCIKHGKFKVLPDWHLECKTGGCKKCENEYLKEKFVEKVKSLHGNKFDLTESIYNGVYNNITVKCNKHGVFTVKAKRLIEKNVCGCKSCGKESFIEKMALTTEIFIERAKIIYENKYDYSKVNYINDTIKVCIVCPKDGHGEFYQLPLNHIGKIPHGCLKCSICISKSEKEWLDKIGINKKYRNYKIIINNKKYFVDGFDPVTHTIYEFNGDFWHGNPKIYNWSDINKRNKKTFGKLYSETVNKEIILKNNGYKFISIWESDWNRLKGLL